MTEMWFPVSHGLSTSAGDGQGTDGARAGGMGLFLLRWCFCFQLLCWQ